MDIFYNQILEYNIQLSSRLIAQWNYHVHYLNIKANNPTFFIRYINAAPNVWET